MVDRGLTEKVRNEYQLRFYFNECGKLGDPLITLSDVTFG